MHLPGAVSPWLRGFSQPLLQGGPATGSSSVQQPCCGPPRPRCRTEVGRSWGWSQKQLVQPGTGKRCGSLLQTPSCSHSPMLRSMAMAVTGAFVRHGRRRFLAIPAVLCAGSPGWHLAGLAGATATGHGAGRRCSSATTVRWRHGAAAAPVTVTPTCANSSNLGTGNQDGGTERSHGREG